MRGAMLLMMLMAGTASAQPPDLPPLPVPVAVAPVPADPTLLTLIDALKDPDAEVRQSLAIALANAGESAVEPLIKILADPSREKRSGAAYALGQIGPPAKSALPSLMTALQDKDLIVRRQVAYAISRITARVSP